MNLKLITNAMSNRRPFYFAKIILALSITYTTLGLPVIGHAQTASKVDVFLLFDDTGSFSTFTPTVTNLFSELATALESALPNVDFGFGVGRFKDFGGSGWDFCSNRSENCADDFPRRVNGRPFYLNQPIISSSSVGGKSERDALIVQALQRSGPGTGGDDPESHIEALWQILSGSGFDGNADGSVNGSDYTQVAGANSTQTNADQSGDIPGFSSLTGLPSSGNIGGAGFRSDALKLIILATEICSVIPFSAGTSIPDTVVGRYSNESVADFACISTTPGDDRFGFISDSVSAATNTVINAVAPKGAASFLDTVAALNAADIRVLAMGPGLVAKPSGTGPGHEPSGFLSALARITGAVDNHGSPLVFDFAVGRETLKDRIVQSLVVASTVTPVKPSNPANPVAPGNPSSPSNPEGSPNPINPVVPTNEINPTNPSCTDQDLNLRVKNTNLTLLQQRKLALSLAKKIQSKDMYKKTTKQTQAMITKKDQALKKYPLIASVCQNNACAASDHSSTIKVLVDTSKKFDRSILSYIKTLKRNSKNTKKAKAQAAKQTAQAVKLRAQSALDIGALPTRTSRCS